MSDEFDEDDHRFRKELGQWCLARRGEGWSEAEIKRGYEVQKAQLIKSAGTPQECAPEGLSAKQLEMLNAQRALEGLSALRPASEPADRPDLHRDLTKQKIAAQELERASLGFKGEPHRFDSDGAVAFAPRGMHKAMRAKLNLERACRGECELLPHPDDEK